MRRERRRKTFEPGDPVEVRREVDAPWEPAAYDRPRPGERGGWHVVRLADGAPRRAVEILGRRVELDWVAVPSVRIRTSIGAAGSTSAPIENASTSPSSGHPDSAWPTIRTLVIRLRHMSNILIDASVSLDTGRPIVDFRIDGGDEGTLTPVEARRVAAALVRAADCCDAKSAVVLARHAIRSPRKDA